ncbi:Holliday junction branch migration protein RuvA [Erysipelothrix urinaevulpis]|uniref:Holliday junction branch migration protein RuvA n=1 Tax=Erysipelothrix urinaevulpis TaxID=2683717 RepID=UPI001359F21A|nr:Holliday junction branch migration protein RuvA [Erysipelothrix urinaevulpis]
MIAYIKGDCVAQNEDSILLENQGIAYQIFMSKPFAVSKNEQVKIHTYQHVREDAILLFGFLKDVEKDVFMAMINVKGIGPKTAMNMLSKTTADEFLRAIEHDDVDYLKSLPGIGKKTASQILLDLKGKIKLSEQVVGLVETSEVTEALEALKDLKFTSKELKSITPLLEKNSDLGVDGLIKLGLQTLASRGGR